MQWQSLIWVGLGGFLGANVRYVLSTIIATRIPLIFGRPIPLGTAFVNVTGSFLLAMFLAYVDRQVSFPPHMKLLIGTGFFGAYTTFSTYANESISLFRGDDWLAGLVYIVGTNILCLAGVLLGLFFADRIFYEFMCHNYQTG